MDNNRIHMINTDTCEQAIKNDIYIIHDQFILKHDFTASNLLDAVYELCNDNDIDELILQTRVWPATKRANCKTNLAYIIQQYQIEKEKRYANLKDSDTEDIPYYDEIRYFLETFEKILKENNPEFVTLAWSTIDHLDENHHADAMTVAMILIFDM